MIVRRLCIGFFAFFMALFLIFGALTVPHSNANSYGSFSAYTKSRNIFPNLETVKDIVASLSDELAEFSYAEMVKDFNLPIQSNRPILDITASFILDRLKPLIFMGRFAINVYDLITGLMTTLQSYAITV